MTTEEELETYLKRQNLVEKFAQYADRKDLKRRNLMIQKSHALLERFIIARVIYNLMDEESLLEYQNQSDPVVKEALRIFKAGEAFPKKPKD
jgi:carboxyl-terminal processing protease